MSHPVYETQFHVPRLYLPTGDISVEERDLGIIVDTDLTFSIHIEMITLKANKVLGLIRANFQHIAAEMLKLLYTFLVQLILE